VSTPWDVLAIPSTGRADRIEGMTLTALQEAGCPLDNVEVWVKPNEEGAYRHLPVRVRPDAPPGGLREARNAIATAYPTGTRLLQMDDDIQRFVAHDDAGPPDLAGALTYAWITAKRHRIGLFGIYPVPNPYFMKRRTRVGLNYIEGAVFGFTVTGHPAEQVTLDDKEDFERSLRFYLRDRATLRMEWLSFRSNFYTEPGGMQDYRTDDTIREGAEALRARYPDLTRPITRSKSRGQWEVKLRNIKATHLPTPDGLR
jgi:hypothetical protein